MLDLQLAAGAVGMVVLSVWGAAGAEAPVEQEAAS